MSQAASSFGLGDIMSLLGGGASAIGGLIGGNDANRNYDDYIQEQGIRTGYAQNLGGLDLYGPAYTKFASKLYSAIFDASEGRMDKLNALYTDPDFLAYQQKTGGPLIDQYRDLGNKVIAKQNRELGDYDLQTGQLAQGDMAYQNRLDSLGAGAEAIARRYGSGRRQEIETDATRQIGDMDAATRATMAAAGLSNTSALANEMSGNRVEVGRAKQSALNDVADAQTNKMLGARSQRLSTAAAAGAQGRTNAYGRASDRQTLIGQNLQRLIALKQQPLDIMRNTQLYQPSGVTPNNATSGTSALLSSLGSSAGAFGGYLQGQNNLASLLQQLQGARGYGSGAPQNASLSYTQP